MSIPSNENSNKIFNQKYPELNIPNTSNTLDGSFTHLKDKVDLHHGLRKDRRYKLIREILMGEEY